MENQKLVLQTDDVMHHDTVELAEFNPKIKNLTIQNMVDYVNIGLPDFEYQYAQSLNRILETGIKCKNRTGIDTLAVQHQYFYFKDISINFPILKGKKVWPKMALKECLWMLLGRNDLQWLQERKVNYWNEWAITDEKQAEKFHLNAEWIGTIGKSYGYQYRNFNGYDQIKHLIDEMLKNPMGRRHIINLWNSSELNQMALPPCMYDFHFECIPVYRLNEPNNPYYRVDLHAHVRSNDSFLGAPYDFMFCAWMLNLICTYLNLKAGNADGANYAPNDIHYTADNYHLYENHIDQAKQYIENVRENKYGVIDSKAIIQRCFLYELDNLWDYTEQELTIDNFLNNIDKNLGLINIIWNKPNNFEYGTIKAEIAV